MSQVIVNIPDCATGSHDDSNVITVTTENCPAPPPMVEHRPSGGDWFAGLLMLIVVSAAVVITRWKAHETKPLKLAEKNRARQIELDAEVKMAALRKSCSICGTKYEPELS